MAYGQSTATCDGDHAGWGTDTGDIDDGQDIFCSICYKKLEARIEELEGEAEDLKQRIAELEAEVSE